MTRRAAFTKSDLARALLQARAENARLRADAQAAVALMVEKIAPPDDTAAWAYGEDRRAGYQDAIDDLIALAPADALAELEALRKERDDLARTVQGLRAGTVNVVVAEGQVKDTLRADLAAAQAQIEAMRGAGQQLYEQAAHVFLRAVIGKYDISGAAKNLKEPIEGWLAALAALPAKDG